MRSGSIDSHFLANGMRAFLVVLGQAERAITTESEPSVATDSLTQPEHLRTTLGAAIDDALRASERHGFLPGSPAVAQTRALIAQVADCRLLALDWIGHDAWRDQPLAGAEPLAAPQPADPSATSRPASSDGGREQAMADPRSVPRAIARGARALLDGQSARASPVAGSVTGATRAALAEVYLLSLALLPSEGPASTTDSVLVTGLLGVIASERGDAGARPDPLFAEAYRHTQRRGAIPRLPNPFGWQLALALVLTVLFISTFPIWFSATEPVRAPLLDLLGQLKRLGT